MVEFTRLLSRWCCSFLDRRSRRPLISSLVHLISVTSTVKPDIPPVEVFIAASREWPNTPPLQALVRVRRVVPANHRICCGTPWNPQHSAAGLRYSGFAAATSPWKDWNCDCGVPQTEPCGWHCKIDDKLRYFTWNWIYAELAVYEASLQKETNATEFIQLIYADDQEYQL